MRTPEQEAQRAARIEELKSVILALIEEHANSNKRIAEALNSRNILSLSGKPWTGPVVGSFKQRFLSVKAATTSNIPATTSMEPEAVQEPEQAGATAPTSAPIEELAATSNIPMTYAENVPAEATTSDNIPVVDVEPAAEVIAVEDVAGAVEEIMETIKQDHTEKPSH